MKRLINLQPPRISAVLLALLPFLLVFFAYVSYSNERLAANPNDKLLPAISSFGAAIERMALEPSKRSGELLWWVDTASSLRRLTIGVGISAVIGLVIGIGLGALPLLSVSLSPFVASVSLIPPMAVLPIYISTSPAWSRPLHSSIPLRARAQFPPVTWPQRLRSIPVLPRR